MVAAKKRKSLAKSAEKHSIQTNVCSNLKAVFFSKDEASIKRTVQKLCELFTEISSCSDKVQIFIDELKFRLDFLMDNKSGQTSRIRCLRSIALCAIQLMLMNDQKLLCFLTNYCKQLYEAESIVVRQYICIFIGILYKSASQTTDTFYSESLLPQVLYRELFSILKDRWIDVSSVVRREAIRSLSFIQNDALSADHDEAVERSPRDMLMTSLGDCAPDCREEAVKCLIVMDATQAKLILNVAQRDQDLRVKKAALLKVLSDDKFGEISPKARMDILDHLFGPQQQELSDITVDLLLQWVKSASCVEFEKNKTNNEQSTDDNFIYGTSQFLKTLEIIKKGRTCELALSTVFRSLAERRKGFINFVSAITDSVSNCLHLNNYKELIPMKTTLMEKALLLFHWRVLIELCCIEYDDQEDKKSICLFKLVPTLQTFCEFVTRFIESFSFSSDSQRETLRGVRRKTEDVRQFCLVQFCRILYCLERDSIGMESWKKLLFSILSNINIRLSEQFVQEVIESIMHIHYCGNGDAEAALHEFCDVINSFVQNDQGTNTQNFGNHLSPSRSVCTSPEFGSSTNDLGHPNVPLKMDDVTRERCLIILNGMLRSGFFKIISAELQGLCESILNDSYVSKSVEIRSLALECLGIVSVRDEAYAKMHICLIEQALDVDLKAVKLTCLTVLSDLIIFYGYRKVAKWYSRMDEDDGDDIDEYVDLMNNVIEHDRHKSISDIGSPYNIVNKLIELSKSKDTDIALCATECLCKWCLSSEIVSEWRCVVNHLLLLSFRDECKDNPKLQACLSRFMPMFSAVSRRNQTLLADVFISVMNTLKMRDLESELTTVNEMALAETVLKFTSHSILLKDAVDREKGSAHSYLANVVLSALKTNADDYFAGIYCKMISELEINEALNEEELDNLIFLCTEVFNGIGDDTKNIRLIQQFLKRLTILRDKLRHSLRLPSATKNKNELKVLAATTSSAFGGSVEATPLKSNSNSSMFLTPIKKGGVTPRTQRSTAKKVCFLFKKTVTSIATLTSELSINCKKATRKRYLDTTTPSRLRRPIMERAAKTNALFVRAYRPDDTIVEEEEDCFVEKN